jgi:serine/threonine-protein kinase
MGEVYRARDARLNREVALKVLPDSLTGDPDRLARFAREAQVLASLNHPNIAAIYGLEESGRTRALVLELVEGPTLADRIAQGPLPLDEVLAVARQIAEALEAAHEQGIVHRDLKPANIKVRPDGTVKVLDFGLAKALDPASSSLPNLSMSPTLTALPTQAGVLLGTAAYMAPEQAKGKTVDKRADIWAFGVVFYEMLTGRRLFKAETVSEILAAVILKEPELGELPASTPPTVRRLLTRCLDKEPKRRLRDIGEARLLLADPEAASVTDVAAVPAPALPASPRWLAWLAAALAVALGATLFLMLRAPRTNERPLARYDVKVPSKATLSLSSRPAVGLSPDGATLAFVASYEGVTRIYLRRRDEDDARPLPGTEGASNPVFSPNGRQLAFFGESQLKRVDVDGIPVALGPVNDARGLTWLDDATLVLAPEAIGPLVMQSAGGGTPVPLTTLDLAKDERSHRWPEALPGGKAVLFTVGLASSPDNYDDATIDAVIVATKERRVILAGASMARYVPPGYLVFARAGTLHAVRFDSDRLTVRGTPVAVVQGVSGDTPTGAAHFSAVGGGALAYIPGSRQAGLRHLVWSDRRGKTEPIDAPPALYNDIRISPDGTRAAVIQGTSGTGEVWVYHLGRKTLTRLTFTGNCASPVWSRDGASILYATIDGRNRRSTVWRIPADGSREPEEVTTVATRAYLGSISPDGASILIDYANLTSPGKTDIKRLQLRPGAEPTTISATPFDEYGPALSPDGRFVAYQSDETSRDEVYVRDASGKGGRWQISTDGGEEPVWSPDGRELFYRSDARLMVVPVQTRAGFEAGNSEVLFDGVYRMRSDSNISYDIEPNGQRFLMIRPVEEVDMNVGLRIVLNWVDELGRLVKD